MQHFRIPDNVIWKCSRYNQSNLSCAAPYLEAGFFYFFLFCCPQNCVNRYIHRERWKNVMLIPMWRVIYQTLFFNLMPIWFPWTDLHLVAKSIYGKCVFLVSGKCKILRTFGIRQRLDSSIATLVRLGFTKVSVKRNVFCKILNVFFHKILI